MFQYPPLHIAIALGTILLVIVVLYRERNAPLEILFSLALGVFVLTGVISPELAWAGFANQTVIAIGSLLIVTAGLKTSGVLDAFGSWLLGSSRSELSAALRLTVAVTVGSAFLLNTAIVAMLLPQIVNWCRRLHVSPSKLLLPISYMAILGGTCTLVGTSTNLLVNEHLQQIDHALGPALSEASRDDQEQGELDAEWTEKYRNSLKPMQMTEISRVGVPCALFGGLLLLLFGKKLLPDRSEMLERLEEERREYLVEMHVTPECRLVGKSVEEGGYATCTASF